MTALFGRQLLLGRGLCPIPTQIAAHAEFPKQLSLLVNASNLEELPPQERLLEHKTLLREAADIVGRKLSVRCGDKTLAKSFSHYAHIARVVASNNVNRARFLIANKPSDAEMLIVDSEHVTLRDPAACAQQYNEIQSRRASRSADVEAKRGKPSGTRIQAIAVHACRWSFFSRLIKLAAVLAPDGSSLVGVDKTNAPSSFWKQTFEVEHSNFDSSHASAFPSQRFAQLPTITALPVDAPDVSYFLSRAKNSAADPDGIGFCVWRHAGPCAADTLALAATDLCAGTSPHHEFNSNLMAFPPKNPTASELQTGADRAPEDVRPLSLKYCSNKTIAGTANSKLKTSLGVWASKCQRGFIQGRSLVTNVPIIDAAGRSFGLRGLRCLPCMVFFDFKAAFPSTSWKWLFFLLEPAGLPMGLLNLTKAVYTSVTALSADTRDQLFQILSGILQGCPLSGTLFIIAVNPIFVALGKLSPDQSEMVLTACADDVGIALKTLELAPQIASIFDRVGALSALTLKAEKCVIVPVATADLDCFKEQVGNFLRTACPQ